MQSGIFRCPFAASNIRAESSAFGSPVPSSHETSYFGSVCEALDSTDEGTQFCSLPKPLLCADPAAHAQANARPHEAARAHADPDTNLRANGRTDYCPDDFAESDPAPIARPN